MTFETVRSLSNDWWDGAAVALVLSPQEQFSRRVLEVWNRYRETDVGEAICAVAYATSSQLTALQTADYLAGEMRNFAMRGHDEQGWTESFLLSGLRERQAGFVQQDHTTETIRDVVNRSPVGYF